MVNELCPKCGSPKTHTTSLDGDSFYCAVCLAKELGSKLAASEAHRRQLERLFTPENPQLLADHLSSLSGSSTCPLCGQSGVHEHTPQEIVIYRNGVKYGRYTAAPNLEFAQSQLRATTEEKAALERQLEEAKADAHLCRGAMTAQETMIQNVLEPLGCGYPFDHHAAEWAADQIEAERASTRDAQAQVVALRRRCETVVPVLDEAMNLLSWLKHDLYGTGKGDYNGKILCCQEDGEQQLVQLVAAIADTSATAQQTVQRIERVGEDRVIAMVCTKGHDLEVFCPQVGAPYFRESSLRAALSAAILGEKGKA